MALTRGWIPPRARLLLGRTLRSNLLILLGKSCSGRSNFLYFFRKSNLGCILLGQPQDQPFRHRLFWLLLFLCLQFWLSFGKWALLFLAAITFLSQVYLSPFQMNSICWQINYFKVHKIVKTYGCKGNIRHDSCRQSHKGQCQYKFVNDSQCNRELSDRLIDRDTVLGNFWQEYLVTGDRGLGILD